MRLFCPFLSLRLIYTVPSLLVLFTCACGKCAAVSRVIGLFSPIDQCYKHGTATSCSPYFMTTHQLCRFLPRVKDLTFTWIEGVHQMYVYSLIHLDCYCSVIRRRREPSRLCERRRGEQVFSISMAALIGPLVVVLVVLRCVLILFAEVAPSLDLPQRFWATGTLDPWYTRFGRRSTDQLDTWSARLVWDHVIQLLLSDYCKCTRNSHHIPRQLM